MGVDENGSGLNGSSGLSEEQRERMERNRMQAVERLRARQLKLAQDAYFADTRQTQKHALAPAPTSVSASVSISVSASNYSSNSKSNYNPNPSTNSKSNYNPSDKPAKDTAEAPRKKTTSKEIPRIRLTLESPTTFSAPACAVLDCVFRTIPGARFSARENCWHFSLSQYAHLLESLAPNQPSANDQIPKAVLALFSQAKPPLIPPISLGGGVDDVLIQALYPFQREGIEMAVARGGRVILADEMGLGKSLQALGIASYYRLEWPLLIITPASMVASWQEQVKRWIPSLPVDQISVVYDGKGSLDGLVNILSYDLAVKLLPAAQKFPVIIADECHALKNSESKRSKTLVPIIRASSRAILLSGTPALSRPSELYPQIQAVSPGLFPRFFDFGKRYCNGQQGYFGWDFKGASNLKELQLVLERTVMIRRTKDEVLSQLPRKIRHQIFLKVEKKDLDMFRKLADLRTTPQNIDDESLEEFQKKSEYMALWKRTAEIKMAAMIEYIDDLLDAGHKMLIFGHHQSVLDAFEAHLLAKAIRFIRIDGKTMPSHRQHLCNAFQTDATLRIALLSITAASTGITLTAATTVVFAELFWNPGVLVQAEDRAHRIGQCDSVNVHYLLAKGTTDDTIWPLILKKVSLLESVGLGKNDFYSINKREHDPQQTKLDSFFKRAKTLENEKPSD